MKISDLSWMEVERYLESDDRCVLPLGSTEQHAFISLATDIILAERVATEAAATEGVPVFPPLGYGITPYFMGFPGTVTLSPETHAQVVTEVLESLRSHGFHRILVVNGHGGNSVTSGSALRWADDTAVELQWHDWWRAPGVRAAIDAIDDTASHASWMETFPWTRVHGVEPPDIRKPPVDLGGREQMTSEEMRDLLGDGSFGGWYDRPEEELMSVWEIAVEETRSLLRTGWVR